MLRWNLNTKLLAYPVMTTVCMLVLIGMDHIFMSQVRRDLANAYQRRLPALRTARMLESDVASNARRWREAVAGGQLVMVDALTSARARFQSDLSLAKEEGLWSEAKMDSIGALFNVHFDRATEQARSVIEAKGSRYGLLLEPVYEPLTKLTRDLCSAEIDAIASILYNSAQTQRDMIRMLAVTALCLALLFGVISFRLRCSIALSLKKLVYLAKELAGGNLDLNVSQDQPNDVIGDLYTHFGLMVANLRNLTMKIKSGGQALATSAEQISASVTEIAASVSMAAMAATETTTTVEEVRQTAMDSNNKAGHVSSHAQNMVQVSRDGERAVQDAVTGMHHVEEQMQAISASISILNNHGHAIGDIIKTVEDVAEQSRLLAVNASIEAVKAGEHGKGFAIVAEEVRTLAEESKLATARVRTILDDVQRATGEAVVKMELGAKAVASGVQQSSNAGEVIQRLAEVVDTAAEATLQISVSSKEQVVGMDQVVNAMQSITIASNQNVAATQQVESAAQDLKDLGLVLTATLEGYRL